MTEQQSSEQTEPHLGLAGKTARAFIQSPLTPLLLFGFLAMGVMGLMMTPRQEDPQISVPMVDIFVSYPGATSEQVSNQVAVPLEQLMMEIAGVDHVYSASMRDQAIVTVQFDVGEEMGPSLVKLYDKLSSNMDRIPPGVSQPLVKPKGVDDVPVVTLTLWSETVSDTDLRLVGLDVLKHIKVVPNTSQGFIVSGRKEQMTVKVYPEKLAGFGLSMATLAQSIAAANAEAVVGDLEAGGQVSKVYTGSFLKSEEDMRRLIVGVYQGRPVYLRDVATVNRGPGEADQLVSYYTGAASEIVGDYTAVPAITLAIAKKPGSNGVAVAENVLEIVDDLKGRVIPDDVHVSITRNYGETARAKVQELIFKLFVATGAVVILVWFFLGWRAAFVVLVVVPIVITFTVFMAWVMGYTIDRVSLFALIFSIGILVDDAIVVVENIYRRWLEEGTTDIKTSIEAVAEVGNPTILATFTVVAAILPMAAVRGMMGPYMEPIPALGSVAMVFSLFAAFAFTPWLAYLLRPGMHVLQRAEKREHRQVELMGRLYQKTLLPLIESKSKGQLFLISLFVVFFAVCSLFYVKAVRVKMLPLDNKAEFNVVVNFPEGTALPVTANFVHDMAEKIRLIDEVTAVQTYVGTASPFNFNGLVRHYYLRQEPWMADLQVQLTDKHDRKRSSHEIAVQVREMIKPFAAEAGTNIQVVEMPPGPPVLQSVVAEVYGPDAETRRQVAKDLTELFRQAEHLDDVDNLMQDQYEIWRFEVDRDKAQRVGVSVTDVNRVLDMAMGGYVLGDIKYNSVLDTTMIVLEVPLEARGDLGRMGLTPVPTQQGTTVPLAELGKFVRSLQDPVIYHKDLREVEYVTAETVGTLAAPIYGQLEVADLLKSNEYKSPDGVEISGEYFGPPKTSHQSGFEWAGEWTVTYETFRDMGMAFGLALVLIYMLVVWEFGNFVLPAVIMAPIPLTLVGIIPGHWLMNAEFTATSMIGFIALAGIIVRNSILLVDYAMHQVEKGVPVIDALVQSCQTRTRPIIITALALVAGSSVILFDPIFQGMAVSLLFGTLVSTVLTLFIIPLGCVSARAHLCPVQFSDAVPEQICDANNVTANEAKDVGGGVLPAIKSTLSYAGLFLLFIVKVLFNGILKLLKTIFGWLVKKRKDSSTQAMAPAVASTGGGSAAAAPVVEKTSAKTSATNTAKADTATETSHVVKDDTVSDRIETPESKPEKVAVKTKARKATRQAATKKKKAPKKIAAKPEKQVTEKPAKKTAVAAKKKPAVKKSTTIKKKATAKKAAVQKKSPAADSKKKTTQSKGKRKGIRLKDFDI